MAGAVEGDAVAAYEADEYLQWHRSPVPEEDRLQWDAAPMERVGPLRFGADRAAAVAAMAEQGYEARDGGARYAEPVETRVDFRRPGVRPASLTGAAADVPVDVPVEVTAWFVEGLGLTCVAVDALAGPQVTLEGIRLIGRPPSELALETAAHLLARDGLVQYTPEGEVSDRDWGMLPHPQRAGDRLLTGAVFGRPHARAGTMYDCVPFHALRRGFGFW
ncbi:hypothetical protein ACFY00_20305 [Kitasatospora sp. NPDC001540]|uniref:hypothetical protein n=1 Tax=Kitasatospora sp. NPDC001540 TaxID=3364014 RepID=UPI0036A4ECF0